MHKTFYASGFLFHIPTQQILLHQVPTSDTASPVWSLFSGQNNTNEEANATFKRVLEENLSLKLPMDEIHSVYDYQTDTGEHHFMHYTLIDMPVEKIVHAKGYPIAWFNFRQLNRTPIHPQTKQDITVAERVINMKIRELLPPEEKPINR